LFEPNQHRLQSAAAPYPPYSELSLILPSKTLSRIISEKGCRFSDEMMLRQGTKAFFAFAFAAAANGKFI